MKNLRLEKIRYILTIVFSLIICFCLLMSSYDVHAQNLITSPECVTYDAIYDRYLVSCFSTGCVVAISSQGVQSYWKTGLGYCLSSTICGNVFYISIGKTIRGFNLTTGNQVMSVYIPSSHQLDGMEADTSGNLYIADFHYGGSDDQIFKINLNTHAYWAFVPPGHGLQEAPQDIAYDRQNNRLIVVSAYVTPIVAVNLTDSSVTTVFNSPTVNNFDGIAEDNWGYFYATAWTTGTVYKFDHNFLNTPLEFATGLIAPANLGYNPVGNKLAVPLYTADTVIFLTPIPEGIHNQFESVPKDFVLYQNYPNPFNPFTTLSFRVINAQFVTLRVFDITGAQAAEIFKGKVNEGLHTFDWNGTDFSSGIYFYNLETSSGTECRKMTLLK